MAAESTGSPQPGPTHAEWRARALAGERGGCAQRVGGFAGLPALLQQLGANPAATLAAVGLPADAIASPEARIPYVALGRLLAEGARIARCPHFGLLAGRQWQIADLGLVGTVARNAATVGDALRFLTVYQHLNSQGGLAFVLERGTTAEFGYAIYRAEVPGSTLIYDSMLAGGYNFLRELCGPQWQPSEVLFSHSAPENVLPYRQTFKLLPRFDSEYCAFRFPVRWLQQPIEQADPRAHREARERAEREGQRDLHERSARALRLLLLSGPANGDAVAGLLAMHRRTLNRRLKAEGTTFQAVLDEVRDAVARELLAGSQVKLDDIAASLGYSGVPPFMRAFRRWTGMTPAHWRRTMHEAQAPTTEPAVDAAHRAPIAA